MKNGRHGRLPGAHAPMLSHHGVLHTWKGFQLLKPIVASRCLDVVIRCQVAAHASLRASAELIAQLRRQPCAVGPEPLPASFLRHSEEQTVVALTAVLRAVTRAGWEGRSFADWGIVAAGNFFGRNGMAQT